MNCIDRAKRLTTDKMIVYLPHVLNVHQESSWQGRTTLFFDIEHLKKETTDKFRRVKSLMVTHVVQ